MKIRSWTQSLMLHSRMFSEWKRYPEWHFVFLSFVRRREVDDICRKLEILTKEKEEEFVRKPDFASEEDILEKIETRPSETVNF